MNSNNKKTLDEEVKELKKIPGGVKGEKFFVFISYVRNKEGEEGVEKLLKKMRDFGCPIDLKEMSHFKMYPEYYRVVLMVVTKELFGWTEKDVFEMGYYSPRYSFLTKLLMRHFISIRKVFEMTPVFWSKHHDFGSVEPISLDEKKGYAVIRLSDYKFHPLMCGHFAGYFKGVAELCLKNKKVDVEEIKCMHKGDDFHEYRIMWP